jgi:hypothetical protein
MTYFGKNEDCPPSQDLLAFQNGDISVGDGAHIRRHLAACEFCSAEVDFYERYPQADETMETPESPEMPAPLYELAEALMGKRYKPAEIDHLIGEIDCASRDRSS